MALIRTARLELRDFDPDDFGDVHEYASDPEVTRFMSWGPNDEAETQAFLQRAISDAALEPRLDYNLALVRLEDGKVIGAGAIHSRRAVYREFETGYCLNRAFWGQGYAGEALEGLLGVAFAQAGAHRVYALVDPANTSSVRVVERAKFRLEGHIRRDSFIHGEWRDSLVYALLEDEWKRRGDRS